MCSSREQVSRWVALLLRANDQMLNVIHIKIVSKTSFIKVGSLDDMSSKSDSRVDSRQPWMQMYKQIDGTNYAEAVSCSTVSCKLKLD